MSSELLVLLPPSETKRDGGISAFCGGLTGVQPEAVSPAGTRAAWATHPGALRWPDLEPVRGSIADELAALAGDAAEHARVLKLGARLAEAEAARNRQLRGAPRMPALLRYTGVLYDALDAGSLDLEAWAWLDGHVAVHSALYGLVGAGEPIAAYRCSATTRLPGGTMKARWTAPLTAALAAHEGTVLDLRSSAYAALGPAERAVSLDLVADDGTGGVRALNHFNKRAKGELVRALATSPAARAWPGDLGVDELARGLRELGFDAEVTGPRRIRMLVEDPRTTGVAALR